MKISHRKSLWMHTVFSLVMCAALAGIVLLRRDTPSLVLAVLVGLYVLGNTLLHIKRDDYKKETLYEYLLLGSAVLIVLSSAASN